MQPKFVSFTFYMAMNLISIKQAILRFVYSEKELKYKKIHNRIKQVLRTHRYVIWLVLKKLNFKEIKTNKFETYYLPLRDNSISKHLFIEGEFDIGKLLKVSRLINIRNKTLIDVGANVGPICIPAIKRNLVFNSVALEPDKETFKYLQRNIVENDLESVIALNFVVGEVNEFEIFGSKSKNPGDSKVLSESNKMEFEETYSIEKVTLNSLIESYQIEPLETLIWMDVQGYEPLVLQGASEFTKKSTPLVIEVFPLGINQYSNLKELQKQLINYKEFANLRFDIPNPHFEPIENFESEYLKLESTGSYSDYLFI